MRASDGEGGVHPALVPRMLQSLVGWERLARRSGWIGAALACTITIPTFVYVIGYTEENIDDAANNWLLLAAFLLPLVVLVLVHAGAHRAWARAIAQVGQDGRAGLDAQVAARIRDSAR